MKIIGLLGKARAGKDTVGKIIKELVPTADTIGFADPIKSIAKTLFQFSDEQLYGELKEEPDKRYPRSCSMCKGTGQVTEACDSDHFSFTKTIKCDRCAGSGSVYLTPRFAMQHIGTEVARSLYPDTWVDYCLRYASGMLAGTITRTAPDTFEKGTGTTNSIVVITDVRFINECRKIRMVGGVVWRIIRPEPKKGIFGFLNKPAKAHSSEMEQENKEIDQYVNTSVTNDGTIDDLYYKVAEALPAVL